MGHKTFPGPAIPAASAITIYRLPLESHQELCKMDEVGGLAYWQGAGVDTNRKGLVIGTLVKLVSTIVRTNEEGC